MDKFREPEQFDAEVEIHDGEPFAVWAPAVNGSHVKAEVYFALLAELEAKDERIAELESIRADASQVFKEIGNELGCNPDNESIMMAIDDLKATQMTGPLKDVLKRNIELEAKLANREAQPVLYASEETLAYANEGEKSLVTWSEPMGDAVIPLFTAPPAPAVPDDW